MGFFCCLFEGHFVKLPFSRIEKDPICVQGQSPRMVSPLSECSGCDEDIKKDLVQNLSKMSKKCQEKIKMVYCKKS